MLVPTLSRLLPRVAARAAFTPRVLQNAAPVQARRALLSTSAPSLYAAAATTKSATANSEAKPSKKTATGTKAKPAAKKPRGRPKKPTTRAVKPKKKKVVKPRVKITAEDKPPKIAGSPFILFVAKFYRSLAPEDKNSTEKVQKHAKEAGRLWRSFSDAEKQPYLDEFAIARKEYVVKRDQYYANVDPKILTELNKKRVKAGKPRYRNKPAPEDRKPASSYLRFLMHFRSTADGKAISSSSKTPVIDVTKEAAKRWKIMSAAERQPYADAWKEATAERAKRNSQEN